MIALTPKINCVTLDLTCTIGIIHFQIIPHKTIKNDPIGDVHSSHLGLLSIDASWGSQSTLRPDIETELTRFYFQSGHQSKV